MKKGKKWLKDTLEAEKADVEKRYKDTADDNHRSYMNGHIVGFSVALKHIDKLEEPKKPIIPQFVATFIEDSRNKVGNIVTAIWEMYTYEHKDIYEWSLEDNNDEVLMQAFANGYEVKKEKLYKVCFMDCIEYTIYERDEDGKIIEDGMSSRGDELTEAEIKAIDERYWMFKKEVTQ